MRRAIKDSIRIIPIGLRSMPSCTDTTPTTTKIINRYAVSLRAFSKDFLDLIAVPANAENKVSNKNLICIGIGTKAININNRNFPTYKIRSYPVGGPIKLTDFLADTYITIIWNNKFKNTFTMNSMFF
jgi:hypothetical protein